MPPKILCQMAHEVYDVRAKDVINDVRGNCIPGLVFKQSRRRIHNLKINESFHWKIILRY